MTNIIPEENQSSNLVRSIKGVEITVQPEGVFLSVTNSVSARIGFLTSCNDTIEIHDEKFYIRDSTGGVQSFCQYFGPNELFRKDVFYGRCDINTVPIKQRAKICLESS